MVASVNSPVQEMLDRHVEAGTIPGGVAVVDSGEGADLASAGVLARGGGPMPVDAIMRITSMTKIVEAVAALRLVEAGRLQLDQALTEWLPELADRTVLRTPAAELDDTVPAVRPITLRHLLTNTSGYGMITQPSPLQQAMTANGTEADENPLSLGADEWLRRLSDLPLAFQPGEGWRYHHSFGVLGILLSRLTGKPLGEHLGDELFGPLGMTDTSMWVPEGKLDRLAAAYRHDETGWVETEPAGGGFYAGPPAFDISHGELVSTAGDFHRFLVALTTAPLIDGRPLISGEHLQQLGSDQLPPSCKTPDSFFFPEFWNGNGWGFGVAIHTEGRHAGGYYWAGGLGTDFFVDPDGAIGVLLTQVERGEHLEPLLQDFQTLNDAKLG